MNGSKKNTESTYAMSDFHPNFIEHMQLGSSLSMANYYSSIKGLPKHL
jgi:hypothetical protein